MCLQVMIIVASLAMLVLSVLILVKLNKNGEHYSLKGSIDCAYALNGGNTAYCNDWITSHRAGKLCDTDDGCHPNSFGKVCCEKALKCCNQIATCGGGKNCNDPKYMPTKNNKLMYDQDYVIDK